MISRLLFFGLILLSSVCHSQIGQFSIEKVEPPNWWVGMKYNTIELMVYGTGLSNAEFDFDSDGPKILAKSFSSNGDYAFLTIKIPNSTKPGMYGLRAKTDDQETRFEYPILSRDPRNGRHQGFGTEDTIYLITPDRFANGDAANDRVEGIRDEYNPESHAARHGGDLAGIIQHLDYLQDLGVTAIWLNPVLENRGKNSYHGYATTDYYNIDPRFGTNQLYKEFVSEAHRRRLKVIFDHIANHCGVEHPWLKKLPAKDWLNGSKSDHLSQKHYLLSVSDPYAAPKAKEMLKTFWFVDAMPDLNQRNQKLARYLIQNTIWWIEYSGLDGIREDTYPYADQEFLTQWAAAIFEEYPDFNIVGEIWAVHPSYIAQFQKGSKLPKRISSNLPAVMDFPLMNVWRRFLAGEAKLRDIHQVYALDFLYADPNNLVVFLDNHDISRAIFHANGNTDRVKLALAVLLTSRGIPQLLYGTEIGMLGGESHVELRADFPGGFAADERSAFSQSGRTESENEMFQFCRQLLQLRKKHRALTGGKLIHFNPTWQNDCYKYLRIHPDEKILVVANGNTDPVHANLTEVIPYLDGVKRFRDLMNGEIQAWNGRQGPKIPAMTASIFLLE